MVLTLTISTLALIVLCYPIGAVILGKSSPYTGNDDLGDVLRTRALAEAEPVVSALRASIAIAEGKSRSRTEPLSGGDSYRASGPGVTQTNSEGIARPHREGI
jgi:hypothetical protein